MVAPGELEEPRRQFARRALLHGAPFVVTKRRLETRSPVVLGLLAADPVEIPAGEGIGVAAGAAARDRDAHAAIDVDAQHVPSRATLANEVDRRGGRKVHLRCSRLEFKRQLHWQKDT